MATENQNFFKHDDDTFSLVFSVTDVNEELDTYYASWYVTSTTSLGTPLLEKNTSPAFSAGAGTDPPPNQGDITISGVTITISCFFNFPFPTSYYYTITTI